jgi:hypothetical protein
MKRQGWHRLLVLAFIFTALIIVGPAEGQNVSVATRAADLSGVWEFVTDDGTYQERLELAVAGDRVRGTLVGYRHGYYSRRTTTEAMVQVEGTIQGDRVALRLIDPNSGNGVDAQASRRGPYLIIRRAGNMGAYARPGVSLVSDASENQEAMALARAVAGNIYQTSTQASGRNASVGSRTRLALCSDGSIGYSESELAAVSGPGFGDTGDLGRSFSRRGQWTIVMYAGEPAIMARWAGTGSSYSLTAYFMIRPSPDGRSADVNGTKLPVAGKC